VCMGVTVSGYANYLSVAVTVFFMKFIDHWLLLLTRGAVQ